jgi:penicillin-binding protein-related factor A (putative recombinase)
VAKKQSGSGTQRTRQHIIAAQSRNFVEKLFIDKGHTVDFVTDYGTDGVVNTFDENGFAEGGDIRLQLKASDKLRYSKDGSHVSFRIERKHYHYWMKQPMPVFLLIYDAKKNQAYWLYVQAYFASCKIKMPKKNTGSITVNVPVQNKLTEQTVDYMRQKKAEVLQAEIRHED